ncbi:MAG TPA: hypothetical protein VK569_00805 [Bacteroidota bacterium]|nr:hypothetical protein [Bacteroidota bacterium]
MTRSLTFCLATASLIVLSSCSSLKLERVDFGWPVESVVTVSNTNTIEEIRYSVSAGVAGLAQEEFQDSTALRGAKLRLLRSSEGYYFLTGPRFKHVYVFSPGPSSLALNKAIPVSESGLRNPALNQRPPYVELLDGDAVRTLLTSDDIVEAKK